MTFPEIDTKLDRINETALTLNMINYQVAELLRIKEELEARLCALVEHDDDSQKTYTFGKWKVTCKTGYNYSLDIDEFETLGHFLPAGFNPVKKTVRYELNKNVVKACDIYGSEEEKALMRKLVSKKPAKLHVKITAAV